ncbi:glutamate--tRNA ligase [Desulfofarcimen acetoxidans]|uniref:glutamate--tRNA ligase n=1 Tax=Desulfofarcimen acetoxidans TaxID=58138 RepID=UPI0005A9DB5E|nr:glutamate--tRNA ligase [Desulfofarcimen acetoxidans]
MFILSGIRVRFAPSPTGPLHIGGARSALFNWLFARNNNGVFLVRIEDTDLERSSRASEENILNSLKWLGMDWDEGIEVGGENGPYRQTERLGIYHSCIKTLLDSGNAYYCYCSEEELAAEREDLMSRGELPRYLGKCRNLTAEDRCRYESEGRKPVLRFRVPVGQVITVNDQVRGNVSFECEGIGDFVILKSDQIPTYNFAVVVDDHYMKISHVIRAEEHLSNTPRQILLYQALGWEVPQFAHISLILGQDRSKMSKRHGATSIEQYISLGYLPEALVNFLALLGWSPGGEEEIFTLDLLKKQFSLDRVAKNPAVFNMEKLNWLNGYYIRNADIDRITELAVPFLKSAGYLVGDVSQEQFSWLKKLMSVVRDYISCLSEVPLYADLFFKEKIIYDEAAWDILRQEQAPVVLSCLRDKISSMEKDDITEGAIKKTLKAITKELGLGGKLVYVPIRIALTGKTHGPELYQVIPLFGREVTLARLDDSLKA